MGLDMYAYKLPLPVVEKYVKHLDDPVGDVTAYNFPARKAARYFSGFTDKADEELALLSTVDREAYWESLRKADRLANESGCIDSQYHYWRKFNALHGWMEDLWRERTGAGAAEDFNCQTVRLYRKDIEALAEARDKNQLHPRGGFFFGAETIYPEDLESLDSFLLKASKDVDDNAIFYDSWW